MIDYSVGVCDSVPGSQTLSRVGIIEIAIALVCTREGANTSPFLPPSIAPLHRGYEPKLT